MRAYILLLIYVTISLQPLHASSYEEYDDGAESTFSGSSVSYEDDIDDPVSLPAQYIQVTELSDLRASSFGKGDIVILGEDPGIYDLETGQAYPWLGDFITVLNNSGAKVLSMIFQPQANARKSQLLRERLSHAGFQLSSILDNQYMRACLAKSGLHVDNGILVRENFYRMLVDFQHLMNVLSSGNIKCNRVFYFDSHLEVQQMLWKEEFPLAVTMIYRLTRETLHSVNHLRYTLLSKPDWQILLKLPVNDLIEAIRDSPEILLDSFDPFPDTEGLSFCTAIVMKGKAKAIYRAFRRIPTKSRPFNRCIHFLLTKYLVEHEAREANHYYAQKITSWMRKLFPSFKSLYAEHAFVAARLVAEEDTKMTVDEIVEVIRLLGYLDGEVCQIYSIEGGVDNTWRARVFDAVCKDRMTSSVFQFFLQHVITDASRKRTQLFTLARYFIQLSHDRQIQELTVLEEIRKRNKIYFWKSALKHIAERQADVTSTALLNMDGWLTDVCFKGGDLQSSAGSFLRDLSDFSMDGLKKSVKLLTQLISDGVLTHVPDNPLSYQVSDLLRALSRSGNESDWQISVNIVKTLHRLDRSLLIHPEIMRTCLEAGPNMRNSLLYLFCLMYSIVVKDAEVNSHLFYRDLLLLFKLGSAGMNEFSTELSQRVGSQKYHMKEISEMLASFYENKTCYRCF